MTLREQLAQYDVPDLKSMLPSEKAKVLLEHKRRIKGERRRSDRNWRTRDILAERFGMPSRSVARLLRLNDLIPELQTMADRKALGLYAAEALSYLGKSAQRELAEYLWRCKEPVSIKLAEELRALYEDKQWDMERVHELFQ